MPLYRYVSKNIFVCLTRYASERDCTSIAQNSLVAFQDRYYA